MKKYVILPLILAFLLTGCSQPETTASSVTQSHTPVQSADTSKEAEQYSADIFAMDTYMNLKVWSTDDGECIQQATERIQELENLFSVTNPESDISRINAGNGKPVTVSDDTVKLLQKAIQIGNDSNGALDVSVYPVLKAWGFTTDSMQVPDDTTISELLQYVDYTQIQLDGNQVTIPENMMIDMGALAKGYTSNEVIRIFRESGATSAIISLGGNVQALGQKQDGSLWKVGVVNPFIPEENMCVLEIENKAVITSGNYERFFTDDEGNVYWHIIDKNDGFPADNGLVSVTIIGEDGLNCDALSTALFVEGTENAISHWKKSNDFEMILVTDDSRIIISDGIQDSFTNKSSMPVEVIKHE